MVYVDIEKYIKKEDDLALEKYDVDYEITVNLVPYKEISYKYDSGYGAYCCELVENKDEMPDTFKISGNFLEQLNIGQTYQAHGKVQIYNKKKQLKVDKIKKIQPITPRTIKQFLKSLEGMGPFYDIIYEEYGEKSLEIIKSNPLELKKISPGLYDSLLMSWQKQLLELKDSEEYLSTLINYGLKPIQAKHFYDLYQELSIEKLKENPYRLIKEISGFGFLKSDTIAKNIGFPLNNEIRINEAIKYILNTAKYDGNTYMTKTELLSKVSDLLAIKLPVNDMKKLYKENINKEKVLYKIGELKFNIDIKDIKKSLDNYSNISKYNKQGKNDAKLVIFNIEKEKILEQMEFLKISGEIILTGHINDKNCKIYDKSLYLCEEFIANKLFQIESNKQIPNIDIKPLLNNYLNNQKITLEDEQYNAVVNSASTIGGFNIINGSAGCGKTFTLNIALKLIEYVYEKNFGYFEPIVLAPTGRAAKVAAIATKREASTIHKALKPMIGGGFYYNAQNNLPYNCIICDETSMLDVEIAKYLLEAISNRTKVIFIGDTKQLASVGPGNVLKDIIDSFKFKVTTLTVAKRQALDSGIYKNANRIIKGQMISTEKETNDAFVYKALDNETALNKVLKLYQNLYNSLKLDQIQVLVPQKTGLLGTNYLNFILQEKFNPDTEGLRLLNKQISIIDKDGKTGKYDLFFKKNDKVIHTENDYILPWYQLIKGKLVLDEKNICGVSNGETGIIVKIFQNQDENRNTLNYIVVKYDEKYIIYVNDFSKLDHAYAMTIHKSQGSEWPAIIMPITFSSYRMLEKNLIYTGYTRSKKWISVIGDPKAIQYAITTEKSSQRQTGLKDRILEAFNK